MLKDKVILALDLNSLEEAKKIIHKTSSYLSIYKIGLSLFSLYGLKAVQEIVKMGVKIFLDLKFHDIPNTVSNAVSQVTKKGIFILDLHILGGEEMLLKAKEAVFLKAKKLNISPPKIIGVTILTSLKGKQLKKLGINQSLKKEVQNLALIAQEAGLDGVVASPLEIKAIRKAAGEKFLIITPGIRLKGDPDNDQKRIMTPGEALKQGADYLVIGRSILNAPQPIEAIKKLQEELNYGKK